MQHPTTTTGIKIGATSQLVMIQKVREAAAEQVIGAQSGWASAFWLIVGFFMFYFGSLSVWFLTPDGSIPALAALRLAFSAAAALRQFSRAARRFASEVALPPRRPSACAALFTTRHSQSPRRFLGLLRSRRFCPTTFPSPPPS